MVFNRVLDGFLMVYNGCLIGFVVKVYQKNKGFIVMCVHMAYVMTKYAMFVALQRDSSQNESFTHSRRHMPCLALVKNKTQISRS